MSFKLVYIVVLNVLSRHMLEERAHPGDAHPKDDMVSVTTSHRFSKQGRMNFLWLFLLSKMASMQ